MKAKLVSSMPIPDWIYEIKFDGYRALALRGGNETRVLSRNQKDLGGKFPEVKNSIAALDILESSLRAPAAEAGQCKCMTQAYCL
jgi:bifunctional non-homologous end joining protein LigD